MELMKLTSSLVWLDSIRLTRHWNLIFIKKVNLSLRSMNCSTLKARVWGLPQIEDFLFLEKWTKKVLTTTVTTFELGAQHLDRGLSHSPSCQQVPFGAFAFACIELLSGQVFKAKSSKNSTLCSRKPPPTALEPPCCIPPGNTITHWPHNFQLLLHWFSSHPILQKSPYSYSTLQPKVVQSTHVIQS